jgi:hypothetical protein
MTRRFAGKTAYAGIILAVCASGSVTFAQTRPVVIEESAALTAPQSSWQYFGRYVALDGDWALVQADNFVQDEEAEGGTRHDGAALLFRKNANAWTYVGVLGTVDAVDEWTKTGIAMKNGVAMVIEKSVRVFERTGAQWTEAPVDNSSDLQGADIEIAGNRILVPRISCKWDSDLYAKVDSRWTSEGLLQGHFSDCGDNPPTASQDLDGTRAAIFNQFGMNNEPAVARLYRRTTTGWAEYATIPAPDSINRYGPSLALQGSYLAVSGSARHGATVWREQSSSWSGPIGLMRPLDSYMDPDVFSSGGLEHGNGYFFQRHYSYDRSAYVVNVFRVSEAEIAHVATLAAKRGESLGSSIDVSGDRVIVGGLYTLTSKSARIFELPPTLVSRELVQDTFEQPGAGTQWQPIAGSTFSVVQSGNTRVYRQTSLAGDAAAFLSASSSADHAIQAEVTARSFSGSDRWFGLATRQSDLSNYYYVTARSSGSIQLKRKLNGVVSLLASSPYPVTVGRKYRLRLESIGTTHVVYVDDAKFLVAYDGALTSGSAGLIMYRTSADYDNVVVSPSPLTTIFAKKFTDEAAGLWSSTSPGVWNSVSNLFRQTSTAGDARAITGAPARDAVVQARVRATAFNGSDRWVGVLARYVDDRNYVYASLRNSNKLALKRLVNGQIQTLSEQPFTLAPNTWYTLRLETIGNTIRVYVNGALRLSLDNAGTQSGQVGLVSYKAAAEFDDVMTYQP